jgi:hypothetical protein
MAEALSTAESAAAAAAAVTCQRITNAQPMQTTLCITGQRMQTISLVIYSSGRTTDSTTTYQSTDYFGNDQPLQIILMLPFLANVHI